MDIDLLRDGEHFSTFDCVSFLDPYPDEGTTLDSMHSFDQNGYEWSLESEQEINGDIAVIPVCDMNLTKVNDTPPNIDDFQRIMHDWQQFINVDPSTAFTIEETLINPKDHEPDPQAEEDDVPLSTNTFDITEYFNDIDPNPSSSSSISSRKHKAGVKKIDLKAQRYIIDEEDDVDVETISECEESSPVLEAKDLNSLLEQFEATQIPELPENFIENDPNVFEEVPGDIFEEDEQEDRKKDFSLAKVKIEPKDVDIEETVVIKKENIEDDYEYGYGRRKDSSDKMNRKIDKRKSKDGMLKEDTRIGAREQAIPLLVKKEDKLPSLLPTKSSPKHSSTKNVTHVNSIPRTTPNSENSPQVSPKLTETASILPEPLPEDTPKVVAPKHVDDATNFFANVPQIPESTPDVPALPETTPDLPRVASKVPETASPESTTSLTPNKQILESLPQELIARIKESGKRKPISVIPPIPPRKRGCPRIQEAGPQVTRNKFIKLVGVDTVQLDHDYCSPVEPYPKNPTKDSGFESAEEDDRTMIGKQPTVKNADGKLMVSLLKVNTIHANKTIQKKKLNFEEYKKRHEGFVKSQHNSQDCSPTSSTCSSPLPEDENTKLLKHQEKLMRMAMEVLNTPAKGEKKSEPTVVITPPQPAQLPPDMVMKTLVSVGINTDFKVRSRNVDPLTPVERLDEMKPLLQRASNKINCNSLITSVIENIPKILDSCDPHHHERAPSNKDKSEHGEDKTIVYFPKDRADLQTHSVECQTNISLIQQTKASRYRRRRISSNSSTSSECSEGNRKSRSMARRHSRTRSSNISRCSSSSTKSSRSSKSNRSSSTYSSRSSSRSRSRSSSPRYSRREKERLREVEERRVIYVGRVAPATGRDELKKRFQRFGPITNISLHSRDHSYLDNYGFVTFANKLDAYEAIEHGNDDPWQPKYDLSFGGRRIFCQTSYSDLDNMRDESGYFAPRSASDDSFDKLLREVQEKLRKRKA